MHPNVQTCDICRPLVVIQGTVTVMVTSSVHMSYPSWESTLLQAFNKSSNVWCLIFPQANMCGISLVINSDPVLICRRALGSVTTAVGRDTAGEHSTAVSLHVSLQPWHQQCACAAHSVWYWSDFGVKSHDLSSHADSFHFRHPVWVLDCFGDWASAVGWVEYFRTCWGPGFFTHSAHYNAVAPVLPHANVLRWTSPKTLHLCPASCYAFYISCILIKDVHRDGESEVCRLGFYWTDFWEKIFASFYIPAEG